ncbi:hypothetical protein [Phormidesmis sp. 146-33]
MNRQLEINQIEFVLAGEERSEIGLDLQTLKSKGVIPYDWRLTESSTHSEETNLMVFQSGIYILDRGDILAFLETINNENISNLVVPDVVNRYLAEVPERSYQALGINIEGYTAFSNQDMARNQFLRTFLNSDMQQESDQYLTQAIVNCLYKFERGVLALTARNTKIAVSEQESLSVIKFSANFNHDMSRIPKEERAHTLRQLIMEWETDIDIYREIVSSKFLKEQAIQTN